MLAWEINVEPEVTEWLESLSQADFRAAAAAIATFRKQRQTEQGGDLERPARAGAIGKRGGQEVMVGRRSWREIRAERAAADWEFEMRLAEATLRMDFAQLVYDLRTRAGLSQSELAERMGTSQSAIARIENSGTNPTLQLVERLARATGVQVTLAVGEPVAGEGDQRPVVIGEVKSGPQGRRAGNRRSR